MNETIFGQDGHKHFKSDQAGGFSHVTWDDGAVGQVKNIVMFYGSDAIHSIQTTYLPDGEAVMSRVHGGNSGNFEMINLNEPLKWVSGHHGTVCLDPELFVDEETDPWNFEKVIMSLKFGTDQATYGPFGEETGKPFCFKTGTEITGFYGSSSNCFLKNIGVYFRCDALS